MKAIDLLSITPKTWGYESTDNYTGNYCIEYSANLIGTVAINEFGTALHSLKEEHGLPITDNEIEEIWNLWIDRHNEIHERFFVYKFSKKHKRYFRDLTGGYRDYFYFQANMVVFQTPKAVLIDHPIVGEQWIPKSTLYSYTEKNWRKRLKMSWADAWQSGFCISTDYEKYLHKKHQTSEHYGRFNDEVHVNSKNNKLGLHMDERPFEIYVRRFACNSFTNLENC